MKITAVTVYKLWKWVSVIKPSELQVIPAAVYRCPVCGLGLSSDSQQAGHTH